MLNPFRFHGLYLDSFGLLHRWSSGGFKSSAFRFNDKVNRIIRLRNSVIVSCRSLTFCFAILLVMICIVQGTSQSFAIKRVELADQKMIVHYDLLDTVQGRAYTIAVYRSNDNFINPLQQLTGDVGLEVKPGIDNKFIWDAKTELGENFSGPVSLEIRGRLYIPFVRFGGFDEYKSIKRLKPYEITWSGGTPQNVLNFDLYKGDKKVTTIPNIANVGHYKLTLPKDVKPGKDYRLRISDTKNKDEVVYTGLFTVKRKTPLLVKILPILALGYFATTLGGNDDGASEIPDPIDPQ